MNEDVRDLKDLKERLVALSVEIERLEHRMNTMEEENGR